jgi:hypothetical protein
MIRAEPRYRLLTIDARSSSIVSARRTRASPKNGDRLFSAM